jgi:hypothetical protein
VLFYEGVDLHRGFAELGNLLSRRLGPGLRSLHMEVNHGRAYRDRA